jgi:hypothetical protein
MVAVEQITINRYALDFVRYQLYNFTSLQFLPFQILAYYTAAHR